MKLVDVAPSSEEYDLQSRREIASNEGICTIRPLHSVVPGDLCSHCGTALPMSRPELQGSTTDYMDGV
jgi:hypothetical protein